MKNPALTFATLPMLLCASCAPTVLTRVQTAYPANDPNYKVAVYDLTSPMPDNVEVLGDVTVKDGGAAMNCNYSEVLQLAKQEVNKIGGNALKLTWHKEPSVFGSSCHQISGFILHLSDSLAAARYQANPLPATAPSSHHATTGKRPSNTSGSSLHFAPGYAFVTNKFYVPDGFKGNPKRGLFLTGGYDHVFGSGLGIGLRYSGFFNSGTYQGQEYRGQLHYVAPELVFRVRSHQGKGSWAMNAAVGFGFANNHERIGKQKGGINGFGLHALFGGEYLLTRNLGIGINITTVQTRFKEADQIVSALSDKKFKAGISLVGFNAGLTLHF